VRVVSNTRIFARGVADGRQYLAYEMRVALDAELAMVLPLPVPPRSREDAVRFVDLSGYPKLFDDLDSGFPMMMMASRAKGRGGPLSRALPKLEVHVVGDFDASFVPAIEDFDRLDERFRLPGTAWDALPGYADWGFAVFKLRPKTGLFGRTPREAQAFHPMALAFPRRDPKALFFPTVHVHDGEVRPRARFDHTLYAQPAGAHEPGFGWERSKGPAREFTKGCELVDPGAPALRTLIHGEGRNRDVVLHDDELAARRTLAPFFELRLTLDHGAPEPDFGWMPDHPSWARDLPADRRRAVDAFARELSRFSSSSGDAAVWPRVVAYDEALRRIDARSVGLASGVGAWRVDFPLVNPRLSPQAAWVTLALEALPSPAQADAMKVALAERLDACLRG